MAAKERSGTLSSLATLAIMCAIPDDCGPRMDRTSFSVSWRAAQCKMI